MSVHRGRVREGGGMEGRGRGWERGRGRLHSNLCQTHLEEVGCSFDSTTPKHPLAVHPQSYQLAIAETKTDSIGNYDSTQSAMLIAIM